ncbi:hypothetical protein Htur_4052 (plasmid) [Haloterrigena turkmenica DSM 5511]|uniref:Uncharacterized protein n=1 Tax=Haloterrigena turkmenica (strain ATCC 51198 / DSM 5511 / JCM 9101 / NCIMB 13204 / VKM B-1734 / 4k) TaxID=543526 RepID=D2S0J5_HALTV|nr:hypothetical protein Htur_4052 [Haloterrigena turkmenica DSM 5511]
MHTDVTLCASKADQFKQIQQRLEDRRGHDLSRTEAVGILSLSC